MMPTSGIELEISMESLARYRRVALDHLEKHQATVNVADAGKDDLGNQIFGICMRFGESEEWYDPNDVGESTLVGWNSIEDANQVLVNKVLPNLGYAVHQRDLQAFHQNI